jgi:ATP-dependent DNA helicase PIF1
MRLILGADNIRFGEWIRNLFYNSAMYGRISLPAYIHTTDSAEVFFYKIYLIEQIQLQGTIKDISFFRDRAILIIKNDTVADINVRILTRLASETRVYNTVNSINFDIMEKEGNRPNISIEFLRAQNPSGLPPAQLELKIGASVICLRNLFFKERLCNSIRIIITKLREYSIKVKIINSQFYEKDRVILRITLITDIKKDAWKYSRKQFLVRLCFTITINKTQGQSLQKIGINLR